MQSIRLFVCLAIGWHSMDIRADVFSFSRWAARRRRRKMSLLVVSRQLFSLIFIFVVSISDWLLYFYGLRFCPPLSVDRFVINLFRMHACVAATTEYQETDAHTQNNCIVWSLTGNEWDCVCSHSTCWSLSSNAKSFVDWFWFKYFQQMTATNARIPKHVKLISERNENINLKKIKYSEINSNHIFHKMSCHKTKTCERVVRALFSQSRRCTNADREQKILNKLPMDASLGLGRIDHACVANDRYVPCTCIT